MIEMKSEIKGAKQAIISLRKIDPEYRKDFNREAKNIAAPLVADAKAAYPEIPLSGMAQLWTNNGRELLPWSVTKVRSANGISIEMLGYLAHEAAKQQGHNPPVVLDDFLKKLVNLEVLETESANPTQGDQ